MWMCRLNLSLAGAHFSILALPESRLLALSRIVVEQLFELLEESIQENMMAMLHSVSSALYLACKCNAP